MRIELKGSRANGLFLANPSNIRGELTIDFDRHNGNLRYIWTSFAAISFRQPNYGPYLVQPTAIALPELVTMENKMEFWIPMILLHVGCTAAWEDERVSICILNLVLWKFWKPKSEPRQRNQRPHFDQIRPITALIKKHPPKKFTNVNPIIYTGPNIE